MFKKFKDGTLRVRRRPGARASEIASPATDDTYVPQERELSGGHDPHRPIGHGNPPRHSQFKKGQSGNPRGRPKGRKDFATMVDEALYARIRVRDQGRHKTLTMLEAILLRIRKGALEGDPKCIDRIFRLMPLIQKPQRDDNENASTPLDPDMDKQILEEFLIMARDINPDIDFGLPKHYDDDSQGGDDD